MNYATITDWTEQTQYSVTVMGAHLDAARQGYSRWRWTGPRAPERTDAEPTKTLQTIHQNSAGTPASAEPTPS